MAMKRCPDCGEKYSDTYKYCPFCEEEEVLRKGKDRGGRRARQNRHFSVLTPILVVLILIMAGILLFLLRDDKSPTGPKDPVTPQPGVVTPVQPDDSTEKDTSEPGETEEPEDNTDPGVMPDEPDTTTPITPTTPTTPGTTTGSTATVVNAATGVNVRPDPSTSGTPIASLKNGDEVFVFTPGGDVINLPAGATPIDFAYTIHSAIGNHMTGAKVNGRIVQFDYRLHNGDVVEVMTSKSAHGPSRDWVKIARSSNARSKIRQWFKREKRDENIVNGRSSFEAELKRTGVTLKELTNEENLPSVLKKLCFTSLDDMYAAIGYGGISALKVMGRLREDIQRILHQHQTERQAEVPVAGQPQLMRPAVPQRAKGEQGIVVEGLTNCLVKFSKCCTPVPGDDIVGFITRGYGISVHRADCPNADPARRKPEEAGRWIKVSWGSDTRESYRTSLEITAKDRINFIMDVSTVLSSTKTHVSSMNARSTPDGFVLLSLDIDVHDGEQLQTVMRRLEQISGVMRVTRPAG